MDRDRELAIQRVASGSPEVTFEQKHEGEGVSLWVFEESPSEARFPELLAPKPRHARFWLFLSLLEAKPVQILECRGDKI